MKKNKIFLITILICVITISFSVSLMAQSEDEESFIELCKYASTEKILEELEAGAEVNKVNEAGMTPFLAAAKNNPHRDVLVLLRNKGANPYYRTKDGWTALMYASVYNENPNVIELLTYLGRDLNIQNNKGNTALLLAVKNRRTDAVRILLRSGARVNVQNDKGDTTLKLLFENGYQNYDYRIFRMIINRGANLNLRYENGRTIIYDAIDQGRNNAISLLLENGADVNIRDDEGLTPFQFALIENRSIYILKKLHSHGADLNYEDENGRNALSYAAQYITDRDKFNFLLRNGARLNSQDNRGITPLMYAVKENDLKVIRYLLNRQSRINLRDERGRTALFYAVRYRSNTEVISTLIAHGARLETKTYTGKTLMMEAVRYNSNPQIIRMLLEKGVNPIARDNSGRRVVDYLAKNEDLKDTKVFWDLNYLEPNKQRKELLDLKDEDTAAVWAAAIPSAGHIYAESWWPKGTGFLVGEAVVLSQAITNKDKRNTYLGVFAIFKALEIFDAVNETEKLNEELSEYNKKVKEFNSQVD